jgi:hypothetical protein
MLTSVLPSAPRAIAFSPGPIAQIRRTTLSAVVSAGSIWQVARFAIDGDDEGAVLAKTTKDAGEAGGEGRRI